jgi:hypothetical protein
MTANPFDPFTKDELLGALRLVMTPEEADRMEQSIARAPTSEAREHGATGITGFGWASDEFLLLLSIASEPLREKVDRFRREELGKTGADDAEWERRRVNLRKWLDTTRPVGSDSTE